MKGARGNGTEHLLVLIMCCAVLCAPGSRHLYSASVPLTHPIAGHLCSPKWSPASKWESGDRDGEVSHALSPGVSTGRGAQAVHARCVYGACCVALFRSNPPLSKLRKRTESIRSLRLLQLRQGCSLRATYATTGTHADARKGKIMHKYPQNQSFVGSSGQTITTNASMTPCDWQICRQTMSSAVALHFVPN